MKKGRPSDSDGDVRDSYRLSNSSSKQPDGMLQCQLCGSSTAIKSNKAIKEELDRIAAYLAPIKEPCCPQEFCEGGKKGVYSDPDAYTCKAKLRSSKRLKCKSCGTIFSISTTSTHRQQKPHENRLVFAELVSKKAIRGISKVTELRPAAIYGKIDFIYRQCLGFLGEREAEAFRIRREYVRLCVDKQDYMINWRTRKTRRNVQFTSIATVEGKTGYILGHHLNYDPDASQTDIDDLAVASGDLLAGSRSHFHQQPQYWKTAEFADYSSKTKFEIRPDVYQHPMLVEDKIDVKDIIMEQWPRPEMADYPGKMNMLPDKGVMTHADYTAYAHAILIRRLIGRPGYVDIYTDQDELLRNAFVSSFKSQIINDRANMAYVQFQKQMEIDEKKQLSGQSRAKISQLSAIFQIDEELLIARLMGLEYALQSQNKTDWRKKWVPHPKSTMNEPCRVIQFITDTGRKNLEDIGWMLSGASLAPVDNYFMRIRRLLYYFERPIPSHTNAGRLFNGYAPYDPKRAQQVLTIFRAYTNYIHTDDSGVTPAMRFGLAKGRIRFEDILYWRPKGWSH